MIVEIFKKGTNFSKFVSALHEVKAIKVDGGKFVLITEKDPVIFSISAIEFKVYY